MKPAIVVIAFNRPNSLVRLLKSLEQASYNSGPVTLILCLDFENSDDNRSVLTIARGCSWKYGKKRVIHQKNNLGVKKHVLQCGDLVNEYGSIIMLEDDITVSPDFYSYACDALSYYNDDRNIGGVSLYNHQLNFINLLRFDPLVDGSDVYFLQVASSWGQAWTCGQWNGFRGWFASPSTTMQEAAIPSYVKKWPDSSWLKHFIHYLEATGKYFVFPRVSLSTNWSDAGSHNSKSNTFFQVPLQLRGGLYRFMSIDESLSVYDSFFELLPDRLKRMAPHLSEYNFDVDLYGSKDSYNFQYVITSRKTSNAIMHFGLQLKPFELNIIEKVDGEELALTRVSDITGEGLTSRIFEKHTFNYFFGPLSFSKKVKNITSLLKHKLFKR